MRAYDVKYMPQIAIKGQILADFVVEFVKGAPEKEEVVMGVWVMSTVVPPWKVYTDKASN